MNALDKYHIRLGSISDKMKTLSGGNQQKVVVARELSGDPTLIIAAHPTRGLDVHAAKFVHERLIQARNRRESSNTYFLRIGRTLFILAIGL